MIFKFRVMFDLDFTEEFQTLQDFNVEVIPQASWRFKKSQYDYLGITDDPDLLKCQVEMWCYLERDSWQEIVDVVTLKLTEHFPDRHFFFHRVTVSDVLGKLPEG